MIKTEDMNVTIEVDSTLDAFVEASIMLNSVREVFIGELGKEKADRLIADISMLAVFDEDTLCDTLCELITLMKGKSHDS